MGRRYSGYPAGGHYVYANLQLVVEVDAQPLDEAFVALRDRLKDPRPLWNQVGTVMRASFARNFAQGGRPAWAPLAPATVRRKAARFRMGHIPNAKRPHHVPQRLKQHGSFGGTTILIVTGELRDSWVQKGSKGHFERVDDGGMRFTLGSALVIGAERLRPAAKLRGYHFFGWSARRRAVAAARRVAGMPVKAGVPLALIHEGGTQGHGGRGAIPARPVAVFQDEDRVAVEEAANRWVMGDL